MAYTVTVATAATPAAFEVRVAAAASWPAPRPWWRRVGEEPLRLAWTPRGREWAERALAAWVLHTLALARIGVRRG